VLRLNTSDWRQLVLGYLATFIDQHGGLLTLSCATVWLDSSLRSEYVSGELTNTLTNTIILVVALQHLLPT
jgi:hypothetical protein